MSWRRPSKVRFLMEALLAWLVGEAMRRYLAPFPDDALRSTLLAVPWVVLGLRWTERWAVARGGRRLSSLGLDRGSSGRLESIALVLLWVLCARHRELGLVGVTPFLAVAWFLLLAQRVARQVVALRPCLARHLPRRPSLVFAFLPWVVYLALQPWMGAQRAVDGDEPYYLLLAHSIAYDGDVDLTNNYVADWRRFTDRPLKPQLGDPVGPQGQLRSRHSALLPMALAPIYRLGGLPAVRGAFALISALLAWMVLRLAFHYRPQAPTLALWVWAGVAFGPPLLLYSYQIWAEVPAALLLAVALERVLRHRRHAPDLGRTGDWSARQVLSLLVPLALLPWLKLRFGLIALGVLWLAFGGGARNRRNGIRLGLALALVFGALLAYNNWRFGHPLRMHQWWELGPGTSSLQSWLEGALGLFYDSAFGLFGVAPWWLLLVPAVVRCWQTQRRLLMDVAVLAGPYLLLLWPRSEWYGGWSPPFRYGLVFLPLLAMLLLALHRDRHRTGLQVVVVGLGILTFFLLSVWVIVPGWTYNFADGGSHLLHRLSGFLGADVGRFFPSLVRPRLASWLWPLGSLLLIPLCLRGRRRPQWPVILSSGALLLSSLLLLVGLAQRWPTTVVEVEDGYVVKTSGVPFPPRWSVRRADYHGGWQLMPGGRATAPVNAGGGEVEIVVHAIAVGKQQTHDLQVWIGDQPVATVPVAAGDWQKIELPTAPWPESAPLVLSVPSAEQGGGGVVVDRVELQWRE